MSNCSGRRTVATAVAVKSARVEVARRMRFIRGEIEEEKRTEFSKRTPSRKMVRIPDPLRCCLFEWLPELSSWQEDRN